MFKKKKKKQEQQFIEDEIVVSMGDLAEAIENKKELENDNKTIEETKVKQEKIEVEQDEKSKDNVDELEEDEPFDLSVENTNNNSEDYEKEILTTRTELKEIEEMIEEEQGEDEEKPKKDLGEYFEKDKKKNRKLIIKNKKVKEKSKKQLKRAAEFAAIKDRKIFRYENKKYNKVEDFIKYLNAHYLDMDEIALDIMNDEKFYGWISKKSGVFEDSLKKFKEIKEKIEK
ncbi:MAG: hypothetical protein KAH16_00270 [Candidatus Izimaplasma sp.]|nr:hypothetical protein [Candidatus Izimaplasma bacterium]